MAFKDFLKKMLTKKAHPAHLPYVPTPPSNQYNMPFNQSPHNYSDDDLSYTESQINIHTVSGTNIGFGTQKIIQVDSRGQAKDFSQTQSHIVGSGRLISKAEDIAGVCQFCQIEAEEALEKNLITIEAAQIKSFYDNLSASQCNICGTNTCSRHCRPILLPDGLTQYLCITCQKKLRGKIIKQRIIGLLLSPFIDDKNQEE